MEAQILEAVDLIVDVGTADERAAVSHVTLFLQHGDRVLRGITLNGIRPCGIAVGSTSGPLEVAAEIAGAQTRHCLMILRGVFIGILCRVHAGGSTHGTAIGIL